MPLLSFQKPAVAACLRHIYSNQYIEFAGMQIHAPAGIDASVSSGKSIMIAELAKAVKEAAGIKGNIVQVLIITRQGELASQNSQAAWDIGLQNSIFSAGLGSKSIYYQVVFGTEKTIANALETKFSPFTEEELALPVEDRKRLKFHPDIILVDEGHMVNFEDLNTQFLQIFLHCYKQKPKMRLLMFSGSWFRGQDGIVGEFWQRKLSIEPGEEGYPEGGVGNGLITTEWMSANAWVVPLRFGFPRHEEQDTYDFSCFGVGDDVSDPTEEQLDKVLSEQQEKLGRIVGEFVTQTKDSTGVLIFCATHRHIKEVANWLHHWGVPDSDIGIITDKTKDKERATILENAKQQKGHKYVLNVGVLTTGVSVSPWSDIVLLTPVSAIVKLIQAIGRVLRLLLGKDGPGMVEMDSMTIEERLALIAASDKPFSTVWDYAGVFDRMGQIYENPIVEQAVKAHAEKRKETVACPVCNEVNSIFARRCIGQGDAGRCEHFFSFRECPQCRTKNDPVARSCRNQECRAQLIDPNEKLGAKVYTDEELTPVVSMRLMAGKDGKLTLRYELADGRTPTQFYWPSTGRDAQKIMLNTRVFYNEFLKHHIKSGPWLNKFRTMKAPAIEKMQAAFDVPTHISARYNEATQRWTIGRRKFRASGVVESENDEQIEEGETV